MLYYKEDNSFFMKYDRSYNVFLGKNGSVRWEEGSYIMKFYY